MINFRYHVVSLTAVFLALAVGLVLGSTVLNGPMMDALENRVNSLGRDNRQLREHVGFLESQIDREQDFAAEAAPMLLAGTLTGKRVLLLVLPDGQEYVSGVSEALTLADATITGTVLITDKFTHPQHRLTELLDLAHQAVPDSVDSNQLPANSDGVETSAALLARVIFDSTAAVPDPTPDQAGEQLDEAQGGVPQEERQEVLSAYAAMEYVAFDEPVSGAADVVVVVAGLPNSQSDANQRNEAMLTTVSQFSRIGPVVVAASGVAGEGNLVAEVRKDPTLSEHISTVDNASTPQGQTAAGLAVKQRLDGQVGHYGTGNGAERLLPTPSS